MKAVNRSFFTSRGLKDQCESPKLSQQNQTRSRITGNGQFILHYIFLSYSQVVRLLKMTGSGHSMKFSVKVKVSEWHWLIHLLYMYQCE